MTIEHHVHAPAGRNKNTETGLEAPDSLMTGRKQSVSPPLENLSPEDIYSVPNPFAAVGAMPNTVSAGSMSSTGPPSPHGEAPHVERPVASFFSSDQSAAGNSVTIAASGIRVPAIAVAHEQPHGPAQATAAGKAKKPATPQKKESPQPNNRRQKRLERNRESARLSRRRRKQYLEVLEERVNQLSFEMDKGRREHVAMALPVVQEQRLIALQNQDLAALGTSLSRASREMSVAATFQSQQLQSLVFPPHVKFLLWMSLQTDAYFRGGRAASERLSAARIGERMLTSGNDRVGPANGMWPLLCNEVGLSYDQEERIRCAQRVLVQTPDTWLDRHTGNASGLAMQSSHDCMQAVSNSIEVRERSVMNVLSDEQRIKFLQWAANNKNRLALIKNRQMEARDGFTVSPNNHEAANLYIINHRLQKALNKLPTPPALVVGSSVKRLSRRPSFESLGSATSSKDEARALSREGSFASSGSLKRSASELEMDDDKAPGQSVSPEAAEAAAQPTINAALGFVKGIMPLCPQPLPEVVSSFVMPLPKPAPGLSESFKPNYSSKAMKPPVPAPLPAEFQQQFVAPQPVASAPMPFQPPAPASQQSASSFLPQPLSSVQEEGAFLGQEGTDPADDFLFELAEEDWAVGEGFEMDTAP